MVDGVREEEKEQVAEWESGFEKGKSHYLLIIKCLIEIQ